MSDRAKIKNRRVAGNDLQQQRLVANAVKVAREMALLPYAKRVASTRTGGRRGDREGGRGGDRDEDKSLDRSDENVDSGAEDAVDNVDSNDVVESDVSTDETVEV